MTTHGSAQPEYCTVAEAAQLLRVSKPTVWRWIQSGRLAATRIGPRVVRVRRAAIDRLACESDAPSHEPWWKRYAVRLGDPTVSEDDLMADIDSINDRIVAEREGVPLPDDTVALIHEVRRERDERW
jgi:excisionase family DNA binding protein